MQLALIAKPTPKIQKEKSEKSSKQNGDGGDIQRDAKRCLKKKIKFIFIPHPSNYNYI